jgi:hypothetical protein
MQVAQPLAEQGSRWDDASLLVEPGAKLVEDGLTLSLSSLQTKLRALAGQRRGSLDREELGDDAQPIEREPFAASRRFRQASPSMCPIRGTG